MLIFDTNSTPIILDSVVVPTTTDHFWVLDMNIMDYTLTPLISLEEVICPSFVLRVNGFEFVVPTLWNVLIYDKETSQLDTLALKDACGKEFTALVYGPKKTHHSSGVISIVDYFVEYKNVGPLLMKHQMLCHPIGPNEWINVSPSDAFNKYLKDRSVGDLVGE